jgi:hypothetical protein
MTHDCPATGCGRQVKRSQLACPAHWAMVSKPTQREVYAAYREAPHSARHTAALRDAIEEMNR